MASLVLRGMNGSDSHVMYHAQQQLNTMAPENEDDSSGFTDASLLTSMDREVKKYEEITRINSQLENEMSHATEKGTQHKSLPLNSDSQKPSGSHLNLGMDFLQAKTMSPATKTSMRSLVDIMSPLSRKVLLESLLEKDTDQTAKQISSNNSTTSRHKSRLALQASSGKHSSRRSDSKSESPSRRQRKRLTRGNLSSSSSSGSSPSYSYRGRMSSTNPTTLNISSSRDGVTRSQQESEQYMSITHSKIVEDVAKLEAEFAELLEDRETRERADIGDLDSSVLISSLSDASEGVSGGELSDLSINGKDSKVKRGRIFKSRRRRKLKSRKTTSSNKLRNSVSSKKYGATRMKTRKLIANHSRKNLKQKKKNNRVPSAKRKNAKSMARAVYTHEPKKSQFAVKGESSVNSTFLHRGNTSTQNTDNALNREKGWIVSGNQPPIMNTKRFVVPLKGTHSRKDAERERALLAQALQAGQEFREVKASRFELAFGFDPRNTVGKAAKMKRLKMHDISQGRVGFTRTTANQRLREREIKLSQEERKNSRKKFVSGAEDRVFFLHHH